MLVLRSKIFSEYNELIFGFSTKIGNGRRPPYNFNLSLSVGDVNHNVEENRALFFNGLGIPTNRVAFQKQVHGDVVRVVSSPGFQGESDAMICANSEIGLAVSTGDCVPIFCFDPKARIIAAIHSGWRSTVQQILLKTIKRLFTEFSARPENLKVYIGPSIQQEKFETGPEVAIQFDKKYIYQKGEKFHIDLVQCNKDYLLEGGIPESNIQCSGLCSHQNDRLFHSYRREGMNSGRAYGIIMMKRAAE